MRRIIIDPGPIDLPVADQPHHGGNVEFVPGNQVNVGIEPAQVRLPPA